MEEPRDAVVAPWSTHVEMSSAQSDGGLKEPDVLRYARVLLIGFSVPERFAIPDLVARATSHLIWLDGEIVEPLKGDVVVGNDNVFSFQLSGDGFDERGIGWSLRGLDQCKLGVFDCRGLSLTQEVDFLNV